MEGQKRKREFWTEEEDQLLKDGINKHGGKWARIAKDYPQLVARHSNRTALRDRAVILGKQQLPNTQNNITNDVFDKLPDSSRVDWTPDEDEALKDGWFKHGTKWQSIWEDFGPAGNGKLIRHKKENLRHRVIALQKKQMKENGFVEDRLKTPVPSFENIITQSSNMDRKPISKPLFTCICGSQKPWNDLLSKGLFCKCNAPLHDILKQIETQIDWVVYIVLNENNDDGLTGPVDYVGLSNRVAKRVSVSHEKNNVKDATFYTLRASIFLGESILISLLNPSENIHRSGNKKDSDTCRFYNAENWTETTLLSNSGFKYGMNKEYGLIPSKKHLITKDEYLQTSGLLFTNAGRGMYDDTIFCFKKDAISCQCILKCTYRKILNALRDKPIWHGIPQEEVKETIRPYREVVKILKGDKHPTWSLEYCHRVLERNHTIKESTMKDYKRKIQTMWENGTIEDFQRPWDLIANLRRRGTRNTAKSLIVLLMTLLAHMTNSEVLELFGSRAIDLRLEYSRIQKELNEEQELEVQRKSSREKRNWAKIEEIKVAVDNMERDVKTLYDYQRVVWYKMQLYMGPARNEWQSLKISNYDDNLDNYIDLSKNKLVLHHYKTSNAMGKREFTISPEVRPYIERIIRRRNEKNIHWMFTKMNGERFADSEFSNAMIRGLEKYIGKRIGSQMQRKIQVTELRAGEKTILEKKELSSRMLHSEKMSERYRRFS